MRRIVAVIMSEGRASVKTAPCSSRRLGVRLSGTGERLPEPIGAVVKNIDSETQPELIARCLAAWAAGYAGEHPRAGFVDFV
jgi:hypothetical protein